MLHNTSGPEFEPPEGLMAEGLDRRELMKRAAALGVGGSALATLLAACGSNSQPAASAASALKATGLSAVGTPQHGGTLRYGWNYQPIASFDPVTAGGIIGDFDSMVAVFDQLLNTKAGTFDLQPGLAESWEVSKDGSQYTLSLRDVEFSNGAKVTAQDVKFSLERWANPKLNGGYGFLSSDVAAVRVLDPRTVRITLKDRNGGFLDYLTHPTTSIVPQAVFERLGAAKFGQQPIGSGPFVLKKKLAGQSIEFARNSNYYKSGQPYLDGIVFNYVPDDNTRILQLSTNQIDAASPIPYSQLTRARSISGTRLQIEPATYFFDLVVNGQKAPYTDKNVRIALNYATPRQAIVKSVFQGAAQVANGMLPVTRDWSDKVKPCPYDLELAKKHLAMSSVPNGFSAELIYVGTDTDSRQIAVILQDSWSKIGVKVSLRSLDVASLFTQFGAFNYDIALTPPDSATSDFADDQEIANLAYAPQEGHFPGLAYNDAKAAALYNQAKGTTDPALRRKLFQRLQQYGMYGDPPWIAVAYPTFRTLVRDRVQGLRIIFNGYWRLENVWLSN